MGQPLQDDSAASLELALHARGFAFVRGAQMQARLAACGSLADWDALAESWERLELDSYMADGGRYRRRRYAVYALGADGRLERAPHQPHWQSRDYNPLNGGVARWFAPVETEAGASAALRAVLECCRRLFAPLRPQARRWRVELHQFRIEARAGEPGQPTPEGLHRDGVDYVLVLMMRRHNIASGTTSIHDLEGRLLGSFTLAAPFDAAFVDDSRVFHGVTAVEPIDARRPAYRDVLVVTLRAET